MIVAGDATQRIITSLSKDLPQGVILTGPEGVGLKTIAQSIAQAHTREIIVIELDDKGTIGIEAIRGLYTIGRTRGVLTVFIIDDADAMGSAAQNALLKLLEEPVGSVRFILTSHAPDQLLSTITSRVMTYALTPVSRLHSTQLLTSLKVSDPTVLSQMLFIAEGLPAALTRYATTPKLFTVRSTTVRDARSFLQGSRGDRLILLAAYKDRSQAQALLGDMMKLLRRSIESAPKQGSSDALDAVIDAEAALYENASVRLTLAQLALAL